MPPNNWPTRGQRLTNQLIRNSFYRPISFRDPSINQSETVSPDQSKLGVWSLNQWDWHWSDQPEAAVWPSPWRAAVYEADWENQITAKENTKRSLNIFNFRLGYFILFSPQSYFRFFLCSIYRIPEKNVSPFLKRKMEELSFRKKTELNKLLRTNQLPTFSPVANENQAFSPAANENQAFSPASNQRQFLAANQGTVPLTNEKKVPELKVNFNSGRYYFSYSS